VQYLCIFLIARNTILLKKVWIGHHTVQVVAEFNIGQIRLGHTGPRPVSGNFFGGILGREITHIRINLPVDQFAFEKDAHVHPA